MADTSRRPTAGDARESGEDRGIPDGSSTHAVRTFLIADVRGYTRFTQEHGDEEAGRLTAAFAELTRDVVVSSGGEVIELRGDEALCVFGSARQALRAAVELQKSFRRQTDDGPAFPLPIGIGLDAGEAVPIEGGYRGSALNTAARLCSLAGPGQILATQTIVSLAQRVEGIRFRERRAVRLKGLEKPVRLIEVVPEAALPPLPVIAAKKRPWLTKERRIAAGLVGVGLLAALVALVVIRSSGDDFLAQVDPNSIAVIDADAAGITSQVKLDNPSSAIAGGGGFVWAASEEEGTVSRYDVDSGAVQTLTLGGSPGGIAYGAGSLWVTNRDERRLVQINPRSLREVQSIPVGNGPAAVAVGKDAVWIVNAIDGTISRFGLARGAVTTIPIDPGASGIAVGAGAVWVSSEDTGRVVRVDPASPMSVTPVNVGNGPTGIAIGGGGVWVANSQDGTVMRIDPASNSISATVPVGANPSAVAADGEAVWVANLDDGTISRIDEEAGRSTDTVELGSSPSALAFEDGHLWTATLPPLAGHRGGVLRVEFPPPSSCRCADPAFWTEEGNPTSITVPTLVYDGLVAYRRVAGVAGARLVPSLAVRLPTPTDDGRTYSFQLRRGIRYSDGTELRASDFRSSLERALTINPPGAYRGIVGAAKCATPKRCNLSEGITADDRTGTITIHLTAPDAEFLYKLASPFASVVPSRTPARVARTRPIPGTGPYRIAHFDPKRGIRLVRNEHFRVWSAAARPDGYPAEIRIELKVDGDARLAAVEKGAADWVSLLDASLTEGRLRGVLTRYPDRLYSNPSTTTFWLFLNTRVPPFDDVRARRALNYATDRRFLVRHLAGIRLTCQILPPALPGYRPYCPYTRNPNAAGTWTAPDLAKARALVARTTTSGTKVEVVSYPDSAPLRLAHYVVALLRQLGYRSSLRLLPTWEKYTGYISDSRNQAQLGPLGWAPDFLAASSFFQPTFSCASFVPNSGQNGNSAEYCDPALDAKMKAAAALQASDPVRANDLWAKIDRALVDRAVAVPWGTPPNRVLLSERVGNYQSHPFWGALLDQLWVK